MGAEGPGNEQKEKLSTVCLSRRTRSSCSGRVVDRARLESDFFLEVMKRFQYGRKRYCCPARGGQLFAGLCGGILDLSSIVFWIRA